MIIEVLLSISVVCALPFLAFVSYRLLLRAMPTDESSSPAIAHSPGTRSIALITTSTRADRALEDKLSELTGLAEALTMDDVEVIVGLDGAEPPQDASITTIDTPLRWVHTPSRQGKNAVMNRIRALTRADVLVFTDVDARIELDALRALLGHFDDERVGAVTGRRVIVDSSVFGRGQTSYSEFDHDIRALELQRLGSVTTCDGKLYAVRRSCFDELTPDLSDDIYVGLGAVEAGLRLVYDPRAVAQIGRPSRDLRHDLERRRRVTTRGLLALRARRRLFDPRRYGRYSVALFFNKVLRRVAAPCLILSLLALVLAAVVALANGRVDPSALPVLLALLAVLVGLAYALRNRTAALAYYGIGALGMSLGIWDYVRGRDVSVWEPIKQPIGTEADTETPLDNSTVTGARTRLSYLISHFPKHTETFVVDELNGLANEFDVVIHPIVAAVPEVSCAIEPEMERRVIRERLLSLHTLRDAALEFAQRPGSVVSILVTMLATSWQDPARAIKNLALVPKALALSHRTGDQPVDYQFAGFASYPATLAWIVCRLRAIPFAFVAHANDIFKSRYLIAQKMRDADAVIAISRYNEQFLQRLCPECPADRIHVIPTGVDCAAYAFRLPRPVSGSYDLLSVGSLLKTKGHHLLIDAIAMARSRGLDVRCRIVGRGPERDSLAARIASRGLEDHVQLLGPRDRSEVLALLEASDAFALMCIEGNDRSADGIPVAIMEAMAVGLPVITTRLKAIPELVTDGVNGLLCEPGLVDPVVDAIQRLMEDEAGRIGIARAARERIERDYDQQQAKERRAALVRRGTRSAPSLDTAVSASVDSG